MPAQPAYAQFLAPQRAGEEVPPSQIQTGGGFTSTLTQPYVQEPLRQPMSGYEGPGAAMMNFATHFLRGASEGRLRQFQQSEQTKAEHERNYDATVQHIQDSPLYTKDFKEQVMQDALRTKAGAGMAAMPKGSGKNDHPMLGMARSLFSHAVGPSENVKHQDIGPEHVSDLISQMHDPNNMFNIADASQAAGSGVGGIIQEMQDAAGKHNLPLYQEDVLNHKNFGTAVRPLTSQGLNPLANEGVTSQLSALPHRPSEAERIKANIGTPMVYRDAEGNIQKENLRIGADGILRDLHNVPIPADDPRSRASTAGALDVAQTNVAGRTNVQNLKNTGTAAVANIRNARPTFTLKSDDSGRLFKFQTGGTSMGLVPDIGAPTPAPPGATAPTATAAPDQQGATAAQPSLPPEIVDQATKIATAQGLSPALMLSVIHAESGGNPNAVSSKQAQGLMQLMPATAKQYGVTDPTDPNQNMMAGAKYLKDLLDQNGGDVRKALAAYNAGPTRAANGKPLPEETTKYVDKVLTNTDTFANAHATKQPGTQPPANANPNGGQLVGTGFSPKTNANAPVTWTPEQNTLAQAPVGPGGRRDEFLQTWPLQDQLNMKLIANYQYKLPGGTKGAITSPLVRSYMAAIKAYNPAFDASKYDNRVALKKDFEYGGKDFQNITSLNTALVHLGGLDEATAKLDNSTFKPYNTFANWLVKNAGSDQIKPFETYRTAFNAEMARALKGGVADKSEIDDWKHNIDTADSPKALKTAYTSVANIIAGRIGQQAASYERGMGEPPEKPLISPQAQAVLDRLGGSKGATQRAPNPNPSGYIVGHKYGGMMYTGKDTTNPDNPANWQK